MKIMTPDNNDQPAAMPSISFDTAAHIYDATRGFPAGIADQVADLALEMLGPSRNALEVGVGTGRIARPLLARGVRVTGVDISTKMMRRLWEALPHDSARPPLVQGAAEALPLAAEAFEAVVSVHVFHLMANWMAAIDEVRRVLRPGGCLLCGYEARPQDSPGARLMERWREIIAARGFGARRASHDFDDIKAALVAGGAEVEERSAGNWAVPRTVSEHLVSVEHRTWSSTWHVPDGFFAGCLDELRGWAAAEFGDLERVHSVPHTFVWQRFRWR
jgi:ubiquinone/menaquinone biosynthesis C-methylase UbiE